MQPWKRKKNHLEVYVIFVDELFFVQIHDNPFQILSLGYMLFPVQYCHVCELDLTFLSSSFAAVGNEIGAFSGFFCIKSVICWPPSGSYSDNMIFVLMFLECPKLLIESYWYHFAFYSILYLYPSLGHYYSCSQVLVLHFCWQLPNLFFSIYWPSAGSPFAVWFSLTFRFGMDVIKLSQVECRQEWNVARRVVSVLLSIYISYLPLTLIGACKVLHALL